uniref:Immunoglobulin V-set domain-containing protein n=1 Tax=Sinocyclocheilus anshuiensis TaxID=1608454 RepID=A0A671ME46_9TELE
MCVFVCVCVFVVSSSECVDITATGTEGEQALIVCPYAKGYEKAYKGFYKGNYKDYDFILQSNGGETSVSGRFSLRDDGKMRSLTVTIRNLRMEDAGRYICRVLDIHYYIFNTVSFSNTPPHLSTSDLNPQSSLFVIIIITAGLVLLLISAVLLVVAIWKKKTCGLISSSAEGLHLTEKRRKDNASEKGNPAVISNSHTAQSDDGSAANTEAVDTDLDYVNVAAAVRNGVNPDQIYTELNSSRHSDIYQSLRTDSVQEESIYHSIDQTLD